MDVDMPQVCAVVDAAELCRNTHPDPDYIAAADKAYLELTTYLAVRAFNPLHFSLFLHPRNRSDPPQSGVKP